MTSIPLPAVRTTAKHEGPLRHCGDAAQQQQRFYDKGDPRMSGFQSLLSYFSKKSKKTAVEKSAAGDSEHETKKVEEESCEGSEEETKDDIAFVRSTFRQSVKRAIGWRKSQRKAVNKRKKENIQNSKLLTGGDSSKQDDTDEYYDDSELDVVVVDSGGYHGDELPSSSSRIPRRRQSTKRPAVSIKSSGFFSQSVGTKRGNESGIPVKARKNKASALREQATKKKLESSNTPPTPPSQEFEMVPLQVAAPAPRKHRASFRTKKGIARKPLLKKEIKPAENKASRLRAKKLQEAAQEEGEPKQPERSDRFSAVGIKTPAGHDSPAHSSRDQAHSSHNRDQAHSSQRESVSRSITSESKTRRDEARGTRDEAGKIPGRAIKTAPPKPQRTKIPCSTSSGSLSSVPAPSSSAPSRKLATPPTLALTGRSNSDESRKYSGKAQKCSPTQIPKPNFNPTQEPSSELAFIPLDSTSLPLSGGKRTKIDDVTRKRKINRPVSNIFDGGSGDLPACRTKKYDPLDVGELKFTVHVTKTPAASPRVAAKPAATPKTRRTMPKTPVSSSKAASCASPASTCSSPANSCPKGTKPKQVQNLSTSHFERRGSLDSSKRSKKGVKIECRQTVLSDSNYCNSEGSDLENSCSFGSNRSFDKDLIFDDDIDASVFKYDPGSPMLSESPRFAAHKNRFSLVAISTDDLEDQKHKLRSSRSRAGSIRVNNIRTRRSWLRSDCHILDSESDKDKTSLNEELLLLEDLNSGHGDVTQTLASRTLVIKNVLSQLRIGDHERSARLIVSLCFPRSHQDAEFKTMRRACQCTADDVALFQNCLGVLLLDRSNISLPVISILIGKIRYAFEVLGADVVRGSVGEMLRHVTSNFGHKIAQRDSRPGMNYRLREHAEECNTELGKIKTRVEKLCSSTEHCADLMALKKTLELFDF